MRKATIQLDVLSYSGLQRPACEKVDNSRKHRHCFHAQGKKPLSRWGLMTRVLSQINETWNTSRSVYFFGEWEQAQLYRLGLFWRLTRDVHYRGHCLFWLQTSWPGSRSDLKSKAASLSFGCSFRLFFCMHVIICMVFSYSCLVLVWNRSLLRHASAKTPWLFFVIFALLPQERDTGNDPKQPKQSKISKSSQSQSAKAFGASGQELWNWVLWWIFLRSLLQYVWLWHATTLQSLW